MQTWLASLVALILSDLASWLTTKGLAYFHGQSETAVNDADIDARLAAFKAAYKAAFDGNPVTPLDKTNLNKAIANFITGNTPSGV